MNNLLHKKRFLFFLFFCITASNTFAYLDPGTGNAILCAVISLFATALYLAKGLFYSITKKTKNNTAPANATTVENPSLLIFSEGKNYWNTYAPLAEELIRRKYTFTYYSMDIHDPGLTIESDYMQSRYIGSRNFAYAKLNAVKAKVMLTTTPNIGTPEYPVKRSPHVDTLLYVCHALADADSYKKGAFDAFDRIFLCAPFMETSIRYLEKKRSLSEKKLIPAGLPYLDALIEKAKNYDKIKQDGKTVLIASTWDKKGCLIYYGSPFIKKLAEAGFSVIVRPHPQSLAVEKAVIDKIQTELRPYPNVRFDLQTDNFVSMAESSIMISDISGIRFDYLFAFNKPVLSVETDMGTMQDYEADDLGTFWSRDISNEIGTYIPKTEIDNIVQYVQKALNNSPSSSTDAVRKKLLANCGTSAQFIASYIQEQFV